MAKKPSFVKLNVWAKYSEAERDVIAPMSETEYQAMLAAEANGDKPEATDKATTPASTDTAVPPPKDVAEWAKGIAAKIDDAFRKDLRVGVDLKKKVVHKVLDYVAHIQRLGIVLPRWDSEKPKDSNAPDTDYDVYMEPRFNKKMKALDPVRRHRINDAFDASFPEFVTPVRTLKDMGTDDVKAMGENTYDEKLAEVSKEYIDARNYFSDAAEVYSIWQAVNGVPGVRVQPHTKGDGSIEHKAFPWKLQSVVQDDKGNVTDVKDGCNISTRDLQGYRPEVVNTMMQDKDEKGAPKWPSTYQALLNSQKPRAKRKPAGKTGTAGADKVAQTSVNSINDWESAVADMAAQIEVPGFRAEFIRRCNDADQGTADDFLLSNYRLYQFLDQVLSMADRTLLRRAGALADKDTEQKQQKPAA